MLLVMLMLLVSLSASNSDLAGSCIKRGFGALRPAQASAPFSEGKGAKRDGGAGR